METSIQSFVVPSMNQIKVSVDAKGEVWFVASEVCKALGLDNHRQAVSRLDDDEKGVTTNDTLGGPQEMLTVNESGLYNLIFQSRKPEAKVFRKWVTSEVLPSIRKFGKYVSSEKVLSNRKYATPEISEAIREEYIPKLMSMKSLGAKYGVGRMTVFRIVHSN